MKIKKYILVIILLAGVFLPPVAKADWTTDMLQILLGSTLIPSGACVISIDGLMHGIDGSATDKRGITPEILGINPGNILRSLGIQQQITLKRCENTDTQKEICDFTGSGRLSDLDDPDTDINEGYDLSITWGECVPENGLAGGEGVIGNLRQGLNDLRGIFPSRLQSERGIVNTIGAIIRWVLGIAGAIFVAMIVYGGIQYLTVGTSEKNVEKAKTTITYAVIGMVIIAGAWLIADFVISALIRGA